ncbi:hypothetical protein LAH08_04510 [Micromonospora noduli]|uniref:Uncharacterized protein n=1 Tax=Micromonospora noduli TaxID=709876 RepID=A0A328N3J0_9ACTN|nr:hypothetical protein LAH08_04510 [Micromonospora noduli]
MPYVASTLFAKVVMALLVADVGRAQSYLIAQRAAHTARLRELTVVKADPAATLSDVFGAARGTAGRAHLAGTVQRGARMTTGAPTRLDRAELIAGHVRNRCGANAPTFSKQSAGRRTGPTAVFAQPRMARVVYSRSLLMRSAHRPMPLRRQECQPLSLRRDFLAVGHRCEDSQTGARPRYCQRNR